jgi:hypothetical protein
MKWLESLAFVGIGTASVLVVAGVTPLVVD